MDHTTEHSEKSTDDTETDSSTTIRANERFEDLIPDPEVLAAVQKLGFSAPTDVQKEAIPAALERRDLIIQARTGSGKTLAFAVPMLAHLRAVLSKKEVKSTFTLIIEPTRELAQQVSEVILSVSPDIRPVLLIGGVDAGEQINQLRQDPRVVVGTPGRLLDLLRQKQLRLNQCRYFVLDEADEILSMGFLEDVRAILSHLPDRRQGLFVSATITPRVEMLAHSFLTKPKRIIIGEYVTDVPDIKHCFCEIGGELMAKPAALCDLIEVYRPRSAIIFCNTKSDTQLVEALLRRRGFDARRINSDLSQNQRDRIMKKIRNDELQLLVATDIAARGLDIEQIELVINYNIHDQPEIYLHRTGRTGRAGRSGRAISLVGPRDIGAFHYLSKVMDFTFEKILAPTDGEVAEARLARFYEIVHQNEIELAERDVLAAQKLLKELGALEEPTDELVAMVAKLSKYAVEHLLSQEAKSLEEEVPAEEDEGESEHGERRDREWDRGEGDRRGRDRDRDYGRGRERGRGRDRDDRYRDDRGRDRRGDRGRGRDSRGRDEGGRDDRGRDRDDRGRDDRGREQDDRGRDRDRERSRGPERESSGARGRDGNYERRGGQERSDRGRERDSRRRSRGNDYERPRDGGRAEHGGRSRWTKPEGEAPEEIRLYIGQGMAHGMTPSLFRDLALEFAELQSDALRKLTIRDYYGFVDVSKPEAEQLVRSLNGIEYNGLMLPVEFAASLSPKPHRPGGRRRGED